MSFMELSLNEITRLIDILMIDNDYWTESDWKLIEKLQEVLIEKKKSSKEHFSKKL